MAEEIVVVKCSFCITDLTGVSRINCGECKAIICVQCFQFGAEGPPHKRGHNYEVHCDGDVATLFSRLWAREEEQNLIQTVHRYKLGNWEEVTQVISKGGRKRTAADVSRHFQIYFVISTLGKTAMKEKEWIERRNQFKDDITTVIGDPSGRELYYHAVIEALRNVKTLPDLHDHDIVDQIDQLVIGYFAKLSRKERKRNASDLGAALSKSRAAARKETFPYGESDDEIWWEKMFKQPREKKDIDRYYMYDNLCTEEKCMGEAFENNVEECDVGEVVKMMKEAGLEDHGDVGEGLKKLTLTDGEVEDKETGESSKEVTASKPINPFKRQLQAKRHKMAESECVDHSETSNDTKRKSNTDAANEKEQEQAQEGERILKAKMDMRESHAESAEPIEQEKSSCEEDFDEEEDEEEEEEEEQNQSATQSESDAEGAVFNYEAYEAKMREAGYQTDDLYSDWDEDTREEISEKMKELTQRGILIDSSEEGDEGDERMTIEGLEESAGDEEEEEEDAPCRSKRTVTRRRETVSTDEDEEDESPESSAISSDDESVEDSTSSLSELISDFETEGDNVDTVYGAAAKRRLKESLAEKKNKITAIRASKMYELGSDDDYRTADEETVLIPMATFAMARKRQALGKQLQQRVDEFYDFDQESNCYVPKWPRPPMSPRLEAEINQFAHFELDRICGLRRSSPVQDDASPPLTPHPQDQEDLDRTPEARFGDASEILEQLPLAIRQANNFEHTTRTVDFIDFHADHPSWQKFIMEHLLANADIPHAPPSSECESLTDEMAEELMEYLGYAIELEDEEEEEVEGEEQEEEEDEEEGEEGDDEDEEEEESLYDEEEKQQIIVEQDEAMEQDGVDEKPERTGYETPKEEEEDEVEVTAPAPVAPQPVFVEREIKQEEPDETDEQPAEPIRVNVEMRAPSEVKQEPIDEDEEAMDQQVAKEETDEHREESEHLDEAETEESEEREDSDESEELVEQPPVEDTEAYHVEEPEDDEEEDSDNALYKLAEDVPEDDVAQEEESDESEQIIVEAEEGVEEGAEEVGEEQEENPEDWNDDEFHGDHCDCRNCKYDRGEDLGEEVLEDDEEPIGDMIEDEEEVEYEGEEEVEYEGEEEEQEEEEVEEEEEREEDSSAQDESDDEKNVDCIARINGNKQKCACAKHKKRRWSKTLGENEQDLWRQISGSGMNLEAVKKILRSHFVQKESSPSPSSASESNYLDEKPDPEEGKIKANHIREEDDYRLDLVSTTFTPPVESRSQVDEGEDIAMIPDDIVPVDLFSDAQIEPVAVSPVVEKMEIVDESFDQPSSSKNYFPETVTIAKTAVTVEPYYEMEETKEEDRDEDMDKTPPMLQSDEQKEEKEAVVEPPVEVPKTPIMVIKKIHARGRTNLKVETRPRTPLVPEVKKEEVKEDEKTEDCPPPPPPKKKKISKEFELLFKDLEIRKWEESQAANLKERATKALGTSREKYRRCGTQVNVSDSETEQDPRKKGKKNTRATCSKNVALTPEAPVIEDLPRSSRRAKKAKETKRKASASPKKTKEVKTKGKKGQKRAAEPVESEKEPSSEEEEETNGDNGKTPSKRRRKNKRVSMSKKERKAKWDKKIQNKKAREEKKVEEKKVAVRHVEYFNEHERTFFTNVYRRIAFDYEDHGFRNRANFKGWINEIYNMGYSQERDDFEVEYYNEAEQIISRLNITNNEGGMALDMENEIKLAKVDRYIRVLQERRALRNQAAEYEAIPDFLDMCWRMDKKRKLKDIVKARVAEQSMEGKLTTVLAPDELNDMKAAKTRLLKMKTRTEKLKELHAAGATTLDGHESLARFNPRAKFGRTEEQKKVSLLQRGTILEIDNRITRELERLSLVTRCTSDRPRKSPSLAI